MSKVFRFGEGSLDLEKHYFRDELKRFFWERGRESTILFTGKYKHTKSDWAVFTTIREYVHGKKTLTLCNHVNLLRIHVKQHIALLPEMHGRKFYFWANFVEYKHFGADRSGLRLAQEAPTPPVWIADPHRRQPFLPGMTVAEPEK